MFIKSALIIFLLLISPTYIYARVTPEDIINQKLESYHQKVASYSPENQQKLEKLSDQIVLINKSRSDELARIMGRQAAILNEYERRLNGKKDPNLEKARYQVTFAHEAVAYQAAKVYVFELSSEAGIKRDALNLVGLVKSDLNSTRSKVIYSQKILEGLVKNAN